MWRSAPHIIPAFAEPKTKSSTGARVRDYPITLDKLLAGFWLSDWDNRLP